MHSRQCDRVPEIVLVLRRVFPLGWNWLVPSPRLNYTGSTGYDGMVTAEKRAVWLGDPRKRTANIAIRHRGTIAIDVDEHDDKHGAAQLAHWEEQFGFQLPDGEIGKIPW